MSLRVTLNKLQFILQHLLNIIILHFNWFHLFIYSVLSPHSFWKFPVPKYRLESPSVLVNNYFQHSIIRIGLPLYYKTMKLVAVL